MPIEISMWRTDAGLQRIEPSTMNLEERLEDILAREISLASANWLVIGRQVPTPWGKLIDLLCIDTEGNLVVLELKRNKTEREIVAQILDYGSFVKSIQADEVRRIFAKYQKDYPSTLPATTIEEAFIARFKGLRVPDDFNGSHELVIVAASLDAATERIVQYLAEEYDVRINAVFFRVFRDGDREYLTRAWLRDGDSADPAGPALPATRDRVPFNGEYYVNFGEGDHRNWIDAQKYGFVSAGQGTRVRDALQRLEPGNRIWVNVPGTGYVGAAVVEEPAVPVKEFMVKNEKGERIPILQAPTVSKEMGDNASDPDLSEYLVRVRWLKTVPIDQAVREPGFFGNQNCVAEPRDAKWPYTVDRLKQRFAVPS